MRFSLVLATVGRVRELQRFLKSLDAQTCRNFELIVVDQNPDDRLTAILEKYRGCFSLIHLRSQRGLSRARNIGLKHLNGEIVAFPDDDCWYPPDLLEQVAAFWEKHLSWDGVLGRLIWDDVCINEAQPSKLKAANIFNITTSTHSVTLFLTRDSLDAVNGFDEELGLGSGTEWGGGEDIDLLVRSLKSGFRICYNQGFRVYHPDPRKGYTSVRRGFLYGAGLGRVLRKHGYPAWFVIYHWLRSLGAAGFALIQGQLGKARYYWAVFRGKLAGWWNGA